jgi:hypothetical protein
MSLLSEASLVLVPSGYKTSKLYSQVPTDGSGDLSFTRASNATRVNSAGLVEVTPWNLVEQSNTFNTTWTSGGPGGTATSGQADPNGGTNAWLLTKLGETGRIEQTINVGGVQTFFMYAKKNTSDFILINIYDGTTSHECWFNLSTGVVGTQNSATGSIESVGNGWYKCLVTSTNAYASGIIQIYQSDNNGVVTGTSGSIYIFNSQLNIGSTAKPYFPTTDRLNVPRLTYQNGGGGCPSLLLEKQSTNLVQYSEQFDNAAWGKDGNNGVVSNTITSPDGTQNADTLQCTSASNQLNIYQVLILSSSTQYVYSVWFKKKNTNNVEIYAFSTISPTGFIARVSVDFDNGTITQISGSGAKIDAFSNGWFRVSLPYTSTSTSISHGIYYPTNGVNDVYAWGAQVEASSYPTSYIPTTSASATRVKDACYKTGVSSLIGQTEGTLFADVNWVVKSESGSPIVSILTINNNVANVDNCIILGIERQSGGGNRVYCLVQNAGSTEAGLFGSFISNGRYKIALAYKANDFVLYVNGVQIATDTSGSVPTTSEVLLGQRFTGDSVNLNDSINQAVLFPTRLTNTELAQLTTI